MQFICMKRTKPLSPLLRSPKGLFLILLLLLVCLGGKRWNNFHKIENPNLQIKFNHRAHSRSAVGRVNEMAMAERIVTVVWFTIDSYFCWLTRQVDTTKKENSKWILNGVRMMTKANSIQTKNNTINSRKKKFHVETNNNYDRECCDFMRLFLPAELNRFQRKFRFVIICFFLFCCVVQSAVAVVGGDLIHVRLTASHKNHLDWSFGLEGKRTRTRSFQTTISNCASRLSHAIQPTVAHLTFNYDGSCGAHRSFI